MQASRANKHLVVIAGPTAVGKTSVSIALAKHFNADIISADSRQFYKETEIATAKPSKQELSEVRHHFINSLSIHDSYTVADFESEVLSLLGDIFQENNLAFLVGGSGLFIKAITNGIDEIPEVSGHFRKDLNQEFQEKGLAPLLEELQLKDPNYFLEVDQNNHIRVIRALEIIRGTGRPFSSFHSKTEAKRPFSITKILLNREREELYERINLRMDEMIKNGLFSEAEQLYPYKDLNALKTVGYSEIFDFLDHQYGKEEATRLLKRNSRRYAKRQLTWFNKDDDFIQFHPDEYTRIKEYIIRQINS